MMMASRREERSSVAETMLRAKRLRKQMRQLAQLDRSPLVTEGKKRRKDSLTGKKDPFAVSMAGSDAAWEAAKRSAESKLAMRRRREVENVRKIGNGDLKKVYRQKCETFLGSKVTAVSQSLLGTKLPCVEHSPRTSTRPRRRRRRPTVQRPATTTSPPTTTTTTTTATATASKAAATSAVAPKKHQCKKKAAEAPTAEATTPAAVPSLVTSPRYDDDDFEPMTPAKTARPAPPSPTTTAYDSTYDDDAARVAETTTRRPEKRDDDGASEESRPKTKKQDYEAEAENFRGEQDIQRTITRVHVPEASIATDIARTNSFPRDEADGIEEEAAYDNDFDAATPPKNRHNSFLEAAATPSPAPPPSMTATVADRKTKPLEPANDSYDYNADPGLWSDCESDLGGRPASSRPPRPYSSGNRAIPSLPEDTTSKQQDSDDDFESGHHPEN